jgi:copper chaperone
MPTTFTVSDLACSACVATITQAIHSFDPQAKITANPETKLVQIDSTLSAATLQAAITEAGYTVAENTSP